MTRAWPVILFGALVAPLSGWLAHLSVQYPKSGLPQYPMALGVDLYPQALLWLVAFGAIGALVGQRDRYLGLAVAIAGLAIFWRGAFRLEGGIFKGTDPTHAVLFALGALALGLARAIPRPWWPMVRDLLAVSGAFQALYVLHQAWLKYDILWGPLFGGHLKEPDWIVPIGTLGTVDAAGAYIAATAAFMPGWLLPLAAIAVWKTHSLGALLALVVCLTVRFRKHPAVWVAAPFVLTAGVIYRALGWPGHTGGLGSLTSRVAIWELGVREAARFDPVFGWGLGGWMQHFPLAQQKYQVWPTPEIWAQAHSEPIQWICETGAVGLLLLLLWAYQHRSVLYRAPQWGAAVAALAIDSCVFFPFHQVALALLGIVVLGIAQTCALEPEPVPGGSV